MQRAPTEHDFEGLMERVARGWATNDVELALEAFTDDAIYMEPPDLILFRGRDQLARFFAAVNPGSTMVWHRLWFAAAAAVGAGEYTFHNGGRDTAAHGVAVIELRQGRIAVWREYQRRGAIDHQEFVKIEGKEWRFTVDTLG